MNLYDETYSFSNSSEHIKLKIAAPDSMHSVIFKDFYNAILQNEPNYMLSISTYPSRDIPDLLLQRRMDMGFTYRPDKPEGMELELLGHLSLVIIENSPYHRNSDLIHPSQLDPAKELSVRGISNDLPELVNWHKQWFGDHSEPSLTVDTPAMVLNYMNEGHWCLMPKIIAKSMTHMPELQIYELGVPIPNLAFYRAYCGVGNQKVKTAIEIFKKYESYIHK